MEVTIVRCNSGIVIIQVSDGGVPFSALTVHRKELGNQPDKFEMVMRYDVDQVDSSANQPTSLDELVK